MSLKPFWRYFGGKYRVAPHYPPPRHKQIIEPFAGAAGYSLRYPDRDVLLIDKSSTICGIWDYLIHAPKAEIASLPDIRLGQSVDDLLICQEARDLMGFWCNGGAAQPCKTPSAWASLETEHHKNWNTLGRQRCAEQVDHIRHWRVQQGTYQDAPDVDATWFIDPPYQQAGVHYKHSSKNIDFQHLGSWCQSRKGLVLVCENEGADWLPFEPFRPIKATPSKARLGKSVEVLWTNTPRNIFEDF